MRALSSSKGTSLSAALPPPPPATVRGAILREDEVKEVDGASLGPRGEETEGPEREQVAARLVPMGLRR